ncbi:AraC family transcriptional regulator [Enterobacterales bacterium 8AC]|nr:AraC family transcriptional regulator [Enterobacterales bacterium 8AC]
MLKRLEAGAYWGSSAPVYSLGGLSIAETSFVADLQIPPHEHANAFFCFVINGRGTRSWQGHSGQDAPMALTLFPAGIPHANSWHEDGGRVLHVEFASAWLHSRHAVLPPVLERPADFDIGMPLSVAHKLARECQIRDDVTALALEGAVLELLAACSRELTARKRQPVWLRRVHERLNDCFINCPSLAELAMIGGVSADHLAREFRRNYGCTISDYVRHLRLTRACECLALGRKSIADIALESGFSDQSHFTRVFRRQLGVTPAVYRASLNPSRDRSKA